MSLQVWLPLTGHLNNQGLSNVTVTNNGATVDNNGKIGKCYSFDGSNDRIYANNVSLSNSEMTAACWVNFLATPATNTYPYIVSLGYNNTTYGAQQQIGISWWNTSSSNTVHICANGSELDTSFVPTLNTWYHLCFTYKGSSSKLYVNGSLYYTGTNANTPQTRPNLCIGARSDNAAGAGTGYKYPFNGKLNDVRIYDHALSEKEIKELSKGLVLHYPLSRNGLGNDNILTNSTGYQGTTSWSGAISVGTENGRPYFITKRTDTSSNNRTFVTHSVLTALVSNWTPGTTKFTISGYYKVPSTETYAVPANLFIRWYKQGSSGTYADTGFTTSSTVEKDKWIRFENTYTVPAGYIDGTVTFYLSAFNKGLSTVYWKDVKVEIGDKATPWIPAVTDTLYTQLNIGEAVEYDVSGYNSHGTKLSTITYDSDTARYNISSYFNGTDAGILIENLYISNIINTAVTYSFWIKPNGENGARSVYFGSYYNTSWSVEKTTSNILRLYWNGSPDETCSGATITDDVWQHVCITKQGTNDIKVYINGVQKWSSTATHNNLTFSTTYRIGRDARSGDGTPYKGLMSDFRIYATALSADDVKQLYNTAAALCNNGTLFAYDFVEV